MKTQDTTAARAAGGRAFERELAQALPRLVAPLRIVRSRRAEAAGLLIEARAPSGRVHRLALDARLTSSPSRVLHVIERLRGTRARRAAAYPVLASRFLSPQVRQRLRQADVGYVDLAGNCWISLGDVHVERQVDKNPFPRRGRPPSLFAPVSSRLIRALLEEPKRRWQLQELARAAAVSLGQTSNVCRRLIEEALVVWQRRRLKLLQPGDLLEAWREVYDAHQHEPRAFYSFESDPERLMRRVAAVAAKRRWRYAVTSFAGAALVAPFVRGIGTVQWYVGPQASAERWVKALELRPVEAGPNVGLLSPADPGVFYRSRAVGGITLVGPVQLYLDLWSDPARGREQAEFLRRKTLGY
jgi:hypothetical protein